MDLKSKIILIYGPTATGKSLFALKLAKKINGEIVNADSMQVYKELKILTARPFQKDLNFIKHHLYGFHSVRKKFSTGDWLKLVSKKIFEIKKRKKVPILVGGTGLYFKALTDGLVKIPNIPIKFRKKIRDLHQRIGSKDFFSKLVDIDPLSKKKISPNDSQRAIRAYEVKLFTNKSIFEWFKNTKSEYDYQDFYKIYIDFPREELIKRINLRSSKMIKNGAILEVKNFLSLKIAKTMTAHKAIGIHEVEEFLNKKIDLEQVIEKISIKTRQYAKRQRTWGRGNMLDWIKIKSSTSSSFLKKI